MTDSAVGITMTVAIICVVLLFVWTLRAFRGRPLFLGRTTGVAALASLAVWQIYVLSPTLGRRYAKFVLPVVVVAFLSTFFWNVREALGRSPSDGPDVKIPAMAKRKENPEDQEERRKTA
ncbi:MAG TPA: hypothetical protein VFN26_01190 [Candidatus Acidoferrum sp.]|nr:hypothetical protein [Candidatus Acidoferrum sp.]